jgi:hypothetical protein
MRIPHPAREAPLSARSTLLLANKRTPATGEAGYGRLVRVQQGRGGADSSHALERQHNADGSEEFPPHLAVPRQGRSAACGRGCRDPNSTYRAVPYAGEKHARSPWFESGPGGAAPRPRLRRLAVDRLTL